MDDGIFNSDITLLQGQLEKLLRSEGGKDVSAFLDTLTRLNSEQQKAAVNAFLKVLGQITPKQAAAASANNDIAESERIMPAESVDDLCNEILREMQLNSTAKPAKARFEVIKGGRFSGSNAPIDFQKHKAGKRPTRDTDDPLFN